MIKMFNNISEGQIKAINKDKGIVDIYVNAFDNKDSDGDISLPGSFSKTINENQRRIKHFLNHSWDKLIGVPVTMKEDSIGLLVKSQLNMNTEIGRDVFENYKLYAEHGKTLEHSVGLEAIKYEEEKTEQGDYIRRVSEWKLWEYSTLYGWGANSNTPMVGLKGINPENIEELFNYYKNTISELEFILRNGKFSDNYYKQAEAELEKLKALIKKEPQQHSVIDEPLTLDYMLNSIKF